MNDFHELEIITLELVHTPTNLFRWSAIQRNIIMKTEILK